MSWVRKESEDGFVVLRLNRPPVNALNPEVLSELHQHVLDSAGHEEVGALVITGTGRGFAAGGDIELLEALDEPGFRSYVRGMQKVWDDIEAVGVPTIAAINGYALGGGFELALACDLRLAAPEARLGLPEVRLGLFPAAGGTSRLTRAVGKGRALDLLWSGRSVTADEALALGLVEQVIPADSLLDEAYSLASRLANGPRQAIGAIKRCVLTGLDGGLRAQLRAEIREIESLFGGSENREGLEAFLAKREPQFTQPTSRSEPLDAKETT